MSTGADPVVRIVGTTETLLPVATPDHGFPTRTIDEDLYCASGNPIDGPWTGLDVGALLESAEPPAETTHVLVEGEDGFTACIPIAAAVDGVLAFERDGTRSTEAPRFVAHDISGTRTVKAVRRIEALVLDAHEDPEELEDLQLADR